VGSAAQTCDPNHWREKVLINEKPFYNLGSKHGALDGPACPQQVIIPTKRGKGGWELKRGSMRGADQWTLAKKIVLGLIFGAGICALTGALIVAATAMPVGADDHGLSGTGKEKPSSASNAASAGLEQGRFLYIRDCAHCHGNNGNGDSPVRSTLHPMPFDLTGFDLAEPYILNVLHNGVPGSDMPAWHVSSEQELLTVTAYTARLGHSGELAEQERYAPPDALKEAGRRIYAMHCVRCHGESGKGDGKDAVRNLPAPPSFAGMRPSYAQAKSVIERGVPGTAMASWPLLTQQEMQAVTYYIRSLYPGAQVERPRATGAAR